MVCGQAVSVCGAVGHIEGFASIALGGIGGAIEGFDGTIGTAVVDDFAIAVFFVFTVDAGTAGAGIRFRTAAGVGAAAIGIGAIDVFVIAPSFVCGVTGVITSLDAGITFFGADFVAAIIVIAGFGFGFGVTTFNAFVIGAAVFANLRGRRTIGIANEKCRAVLADVFCTTRVTTFNAFVTGAAVFANLRGRRAIGIANEKCRAILANVSRATNICNFASIVDATVFTRHFVGDNTIHA